MTLQGFHLAASTPVNLNVKTNTVTHLMDPVYMDAMIQTLSQLIALVFIYFFKLEITNLKCAVLKDSVIFTIKRKNEYKIILKYIMHVCINCKRTFFYIGFILDIIGNLLVCGN